MFRFIPIDGAIQQIRKKLHTRNTVILKDTNSIKIILTIFCHSIFEDGSSLQPLEKF